MIRGVRRGCVRLKGAVIGIDDEDDSTFTITVDGKTFHFQARDAEERERWIRGLEDTILRHAHRMRWDATKPAPSVEDFDKKLTEADAYLQIIIDQVKALELRIDRMTDPEDKARCQSIRDQANNTAHPVNGIFTAPMPSFTDNMKHPIQQQEGGADAVPLTSPVQTGIEVGAECVESRCGSTSSRSPVTGSVQEQSYEYIQYLNSTTDISQSRPAHRTSMSLGVPETSYSSSEEEDDFFDANEFSETPVSMQSPTGLRSFEPSLMEQSMETPISQTDSITSNKLPSRLSQTLFRDDGSLDYDALYEDDSEHDLGSMEHHGSVVTHLLSQVKIGMDLTKVVLPTFILERRSLLEMYADYFAHPDIFVSIADFSDPKDRMVQVVRWYMSAYHAGRKSVVAKKPYNPVLGEVFLCHWNVPGLESKEAPVPVSDGPVPWCSRNQLTFIAEQVSHHPPISAFYAEHYNKRISFCAHVWTKSKFLGLSIGVHNIGQGCVSVLDYDEEYIVTFPNGYGRSILTVPWIELGGSVTINCVKTGYYANLEFLTKPFYGGKKNRISAEVFQPNDKKPFLTVHGEWNGAMEAKWPDGRTETFVDVKKIPIVKKVVRPIAEQAENESRRLWMEVTAGLSLNDIDRATKAKFSLEQKQRDEARDRKERELRWNAQVFQEAGENWVYKQPLVKRLHKLSDSSDNQL
ncbi:Oxysterol-binding protein [Gryllus bimaculatus]|nr:Oxysterol-binding protein [Gryllus bimaculatus]